MAKEETFSRVVIVDGPPPQAPGMKVERLPGTFPVSHTTATGRMYRCTFKLPMKDGRYPSFAAAEWAARDLTCTRDLMDDADLLVWHAPGWKPLEDRIRDGEALGRAAARAARGTRPAQSCAEQGKSEPADWGAYDVVVVGGGTSGAPAALAAARAGAKVLLVEYLHVLGGVATDGMVLGYFDGNHCGYTEAFKKGNREIGGRHGLYRRAETLRKWCGDAGVEVMFGAMGVGAVTENGAVTAATPTSRRRPARRPPSSARASSPCRARDSPRTGSDAAASTRTSATSTTRTRATCGFSASVRGRARRTPGTSRRCRTRASVGASCRTTS